MTCPPQLHLRHSYLQMTQNASSKLLLYQHPVAPRGPTLFIRLVSIYVITSLLMSPDSKFVLMIFHCKLNSEYSIDGRVRRYTGIFVNSQY